METITRDDKFVEEDLELMSNARNYIDYQYDFIRPFIGKAILEVGGGIGNLTQKFFRQDNRITVVEPNSVCFQRLHSRFCDHENVTLIENYFDAMTPALLPSKDFDTILCLNVLEHIKYDEKTIRLFRSLIRKDGNVVLIVPAYTWAFGDIDKAVGHYRRYNRRAFFKLIYSNGFKITFWRYFNFIGLVGWAINAKILKITSQKQFQVRIFDKLLVPIQRQIEKKLRIPIGQSLLVVAQGEK